MKEIWKKLIVAACIGTLFFVIYQSGILDKLSLEYLKSSQTEFLGIYQEKPLLVISVYMAIYILSTALSLPGAAVLTLAGGALFGLVHGVLMVSFASTIGATLAFLVSRFLLRDWVQNKFKDSIKKINDGVEKEGAFYLFTLRLIPAFPFFIINLVMGITNMPVKTYFFASQIGMLAGTVVYVNAGKEIAKIDSLSGILSPSLIVSFIVLGTFPIVAKKVLGIIKEKRAASNS